MGVVADHPRKAPKVAKPTRYGIAYLARRADGAWLLERRLGQGLLGGMLGWPGTEWTEDAPVEAPPIATDWFDPGGEVRHTFTHFHLRLSLRVARLPNNATPERGEFHANLNPSDLPTVMRKAYDLASNVAEDG